MSYRYSNIGHAAALHICLDMVILYCWLYLIDGLALVYLNDLFDHWKKEG